MQYLFAVLNAGKPNRTAKIVEPLKAACLHNAIRLNPI